MLSIDKLLDENRPEWVLQEVIPLINRFPHDDETYDKIAKYIANHIQLGGKVVYPQADHTERVDPMIRRIENKLAENKIQVAPRVIEYIPLDKRDDPDFRQHYNPRDVYLASSAFDALRGIDPSIKVYKLMIELLINVLNGDCSASLDIVFNTTYSKLIQGRTLIIDEKCFDAYASIYKTALHDIYRYRRVMLSAAGINIDMCSERHFCQLVDKYLRLARALHGYGPIEGDTRDFLTSAMALERVIVWTFLGDTDAYPKNTVNLTISFYKDGGMNAGEYVGWQEEAEKKAQAYITGADDVDFSLVVDSKVHPCTITCDVCENKDIHNITSEDIVHIFGKSLGRELTADAISFELDEGQKAMMVSEHHLKNFSMVVCPIHGFKYIYNEPSGKYLLFRAIKETGIDDTVYGVTLEPNENGQRSAIAIQGDARYSYAYRYHT